MNKRGQASIEFMFLILISIVYLTTAVMPMAKNVQGIAYDTENISRANGETQKIVNAITNISMQSTGSKETLMVFIPENTVIFCAPTKISFTATLKEKPFPAQCNSLGVCVKEFTLPSTTQMNCTQAQVAGPVATKIVIEKQQTQVAFYLGG
jgi:hypothetical protein